MAWIKGGTGVCDTCERVGPGHEDKQLAIQLLRASGWHHSSGDTIGGDPYEALLCPGCSRDEHRRKRDRQHIEQDALPLDWQACQLEVRGDGVASR